jgi:predicted Na+-dependent transporter
MAPSRSTAPSTSSPSGWIFRRYKKRVLAVGTSLRNLSAATAVAAVNFTDPDVLVMVLVVGIGGVVVLTILGGELGKRATYSR